MGWSIKLFDVGGTAVRIHMTFFLLLAWIGAISMPLQLQMGPQWFTNRHLNDHYDVHRRIRAGGGQPQLEREPPPSASPTPPPLRRGGDIPRTCHSGRFGVIFGA